MPLLKDTIVKSLEWDGSYIVTGGTRGFGLQCARWLVQKGARNLVLMSRSGAAGSEAENAIREMRELGVTVKVCALDIADGTRLREELGSILHSLPPVRGVIHSAMVLDDGFIGQMNEARYRKVMTPKIQGAINLARELDLSALRFLLMFSSISSLIGNSGQANYVAANSFLDGYAHHLAGRGIHAKAINWGALSDTGVLAKDADLIKVLEMAGIHGISNKQAMKTLEIALQDQSCQTGIFHVDWKQWASANSSQSKSSFYQELLDQQENESENEKLLEILNAIVDSGPEERRTYVQRELAVRFGEIFKMSPDEINVHASIIDLGVDSLIAAEITMALRTQLGVEIPLIEMLSGPSIVNLAEKILTQIEALIDEASSEDAFFSDDTSSIEKEAMSVD